MASLNVPATFQRVRGELFGGRDWELVYVYLDDMLVASQSTQEYLEYLQKVAQCSRDAGLRLRPEKCVFATEQVEFSGYTLTTEGVRPNRKNVDGLENFHRPTSANNV